MKRPTWDEYGLELARVVATRATCSRDMVGAVILNARNRVVSTGYNGAASGEIHCVDGGCPRGRLSYEEQPPGGDYSNCVSLHAEVNAIVDATTPLIDCTLYVTRKPCDYCAKVIRAAGIKRVVFA